MGAAAYKLHDTLVEQLKAPGRMFIPVGDVNGQVIYVVDKDKDGNVTKKKTMNVWVSFASIPSVTRFSTSFTVILAHLTRLSFLLLSRSEH